MERVLVVANGGLGKFPFSSSFGFARLNIPWGPHLELCIQYWSCLCLHLSCRWVSQPQHCTNGKPLARWAGGGEGSQAAARAHLSLIPRLHQADHRILPRPSCQTPFSRASSFQPSSQAEGEKSSDRSPFEVREAEGKGRFGPKAKTRGANNGLGLQRTPGG